MAKKSKIWIYVLIVIAIIVILDLAVLFTNKIPEKPQVTLSSENISENIVKLKLPAVDDQGKGVTTTLKVKAISGTGRTLVDIDNLLFWADTQQSIRLARLVAGNFSGKKLENYDLTYSVEANASVLGGESAGAALAIATLAALEGKQLNQNVMITGTINHDGTIGPVSGILEKAQASKKAGASILLVPLLQSRDVIYETSQHCETFGGTEICNSETRGRKVDIRNETGIDVIEVENISEALGYFIN
jgi:uncharacterized protein